MVRVTSGSGPATARALDVTAGGRAAADAIGRLGVGVPRSLTWAPSLVSLVRPAATLTAPPLGLDLLTAVVDRVAAAADDGPTERGLSTRTAPIPPRPSDPGRRAPAGPGAPATERPRAQAQPVGAVVTAAPRPRPADAGDGDGHQFPRPRLDARRWTRILEGRPVTPGAVAGPNATKPAPVSAASMMPAPRLALAAAGPSSVSGIETTSPPSTNEGATAPGSLAPAPPARPVTAAAVPAAGAPTSWGAAAPTAPGGPPPARAAAGGAVAGLRDLVQRWSDPVPAATPPFAPARDEASARRPIAAPMTDADAAPGPLESRPAAPVDLLELGDALDELLGQEAEAHALDGRVL